MKIDEIQTPCYLLDEERLIKNLELLKKVQDESGCRILLAQKAFSMFSVYPLIGKYLAGTTASGLFEARLGHEEMGGETHIFSPAYPETDFNEISDICDHIVFNSFSQLEKYKNICMQKKKSFGLRINPEYSTQEHGIYDPCSYGSRLGITAASFKFDRMDGVDGLHFHTLCEQNSDALDETLNAVEEKFAPALKKIKWLNFGGGHHITRDDYDIERLLRCIERVKNRYGAEVYLEPGEAVVLNSGYLYTTVLELVDNGITNAILDTSAACHMPDVLEMPYRPDIFESGKPNEKAYTYRLGGNTCLAGDIIGDYSFDKPLTIGTKLIFKDMALYSMVKNNTFNGICLPSIAILHANGNVELIKQFGYKDFKERLS